MTEIAKRQDVLTVREADVSHSLFSASNLTGSRFENVDLTDVEISDADLSGAILDNVKLTDARVRNADLGNATFENVRYAGMTINGIDMVELFAAHRAVKEKQGSI